jgi:hypothetical protein
MPWECDPDGSVDNRDLPESVNKDTDSFAASIGLEVFGSVRFIDIVDALLEEYADVFSTELGIEPADLPPLDVEIDVKKWHCPKTKDVHVISLLKVNIQEIRRYIEKLLECGAISPVLNAPAYSQVLRVKKPDTAEKRLVLDYYRALNECVGHMNWPLPSVTLSYLVSQPIVPKRHSVSSSVRAYMKSRSAEEVFFFFWFCLPLTLRLLDT